MSSTRTNHSSQNQSPPIIHQQQSLPLRCRSLIFSLWAGALLVLILSLSLYKFNPIPPSISLTLKTHLLSRTVNIFQNLHFLNSTSRHRPSPVRPPCVLWMAPFLSTGGYSSEAWSYIKSLATNFDNSDFALKILHHGDSESVRFWQGLHESDRELAYQLYNARCRLNETIVVCHSEPGAWYLPLFETLPCPPTGYADPLLVVGRTMFETDRLSAEHVKRCNRMGVVWVPTECHVSTFVESGIDLSKVVKLVQPVDVEFFDPSRHQPLVLDTRRPIMGSSSGADDRFVFLSVFKWEHRKGWDVLLKAFLQEFSSDDNVALYLLVSAYHSDTDFGDKISKFVDEIGLKEPGPLDRSSRASV